MPEFLEYLEKHSGLFVAIGAILGIVGVIGGWLISLFRKRQREQKGFEPPVKIGDLSKDPDFSKPEKDVVVIAARVAWNTYQKYHAYICQADRPLGQAKYLAFYANGEIQPLVPEILEQHPTVPGDSRTVKIRSCRQE